MTYQAATEEAPEQAPGIGHNLPADQAEEIAAQLPIDYAELVARHAELMEAQENAPTVIDDEDAKERALDHVKSLTTLRKRAEALRVDLKEPHLSAGRAVDGFFVPLRDDCDKASKQAKAPITVYDDRKAEALRIEREEEARREREEADRLRREAEERERVAREEEERRQRELAEAEAQRKREADERAAAIQNEEDLKAAEAREREDAKTKKLEEQQAARDQRADDKVAREANKEAARADRTAHKAERHAGANDAELSRTRSQHGAVGSLTSKWTGEVAKIDDLDLDALRFHINPDALDIAVRNFVRGGGRELRGAHIWPDKDTTVR